MKYPIAGYLAHNLRTFYRVPGSAVILTANGAVRMTALPARLFFSIILVKSLCRKSIGKAIVRKLARRKRNA